MESRVELFARIRRDARVRAYPSAAMPESTESPEEPFGRHWPPAEPPERRTPAGEAPKLGGDPVPEDTPHCGWTIRGSAIKIFRYQMQADGHEVREGGAHHR